MDRMAASAGAGTPPCARAVSGRFSRAPAWAQRLGRLYVDLAVYAANHVAGHLPLGFLRLAFYRAVLRWRVGRGTRLASGLRVLIAPGRVSIGRGTTIGRECNVICAGIPGAECCIGDHVVIEPQVHLIMGGHELGAVSQFPLIVRPVAVEDHAVVGARSTVIMARIGRGALVLPGSVVTQDVPPYAVVHGVPARQVGARDPASVPGDRAGSPEGGE